MAKSDQHELKLSLAETKTLYNEDVPSDRVRVRNGSGCKIEVSIRRYNTIPELNTCGLGGSGGATGNGSLTGSMSVSRQAGQITVFPLLHGGQDDIYLGSCNSGGYVTAKPHGSEHALCSNILVKCGHCLVIGCVNPRQN